ncbi:MAG: nitrite/sulfite reductase [Geobacter sp.]|nr:nitrite/sulfite reductase [Geobacter sp.]
MTTNPQSLRIEGVYQQRQAENFMMRVKVPGGVLSAEQALKISEIADRFAGGRVHLTTRNSIEFHWLKEESLAEIGKMLAAVGLTSRGACGGAVRGVVCSTPFSAGFPAAQTLARKIHHHFTQNPHFEGLPKKFKIAVNADYSDPRHLIQDIGLVYAGTAEERDYYDVWAAGGLGREPTEGFLLKGKVAQENIIPLIESVVSVYKERTPQGKRLKHLVREIGREEFLREIQERMDTCGPLALPDGFDKGLTARPAAEASLHIEARVFAGELEAAALRNLAGIAAKHAEGFMVLTGDQNVAFIMKDQDSCDAAAMALAAVGFGGNSREERVLFRVCPGNHECRMGLAPTRDVARALLESIGPKGEALSWAIAGCPNSCSQPQLAQAGVVTSKIEKSESGELTPLFDLWLRSDIGAMGKVVRQRISLEELRQAIGEMG